MTTVTVDRQTTQVTTDQFETDVEVNTDTEITTTVTAVGGYSLIQEDGVDLTQRRILNFAAGISATDDGTKTNVNVNDNTSIQKVNIEKAGVLIGSRSTINFIEGANITLTIVDDGTDDEIDITIASDEQSYNTVQEDGVALTQRDIINFGTGLNATDDSGNSRTNVDIVDDSSTQKVEVGKAGTLVATRKRVNFEDGTGINIVVADDSTNNESDVTVNVVDNTTTQKIEVADNGTLVGTRKRINLIAGTNIVLTIADDSGNDEVDVTIDGPTLYHQLNWYVAGLLTIADGQKEIYKLDRDVNFQSVDLNVKVAPSGGPVTVDIEHASSVSGPWTSLFSTLPTIADTAQEGGGNAVFSVTNLAAGNFLRLNIDTVNSAEDLTAQLNMTY